MRENKFWGELHNRGLYCQCGLKARRENLHQGTGQHMEYKILEDMKVALADKQAELYKRESQRKDTAIRYLLERAGMTQYIGVHYETTPNARKAGINLDLLLSDIEAEHEAQQIDEARERLASSTKENTDES